VTVVEVDAGCCGFTTKIEILKVDDQRIKAVVLSDCEMITAWGKELGSLDWGQCLRNFGDSPVFQCASKHIGHVACPVPMALLKAMEVAVGVSLPVDVTIRFRDANTE
jgi:hypothetical protein